MWPIVTDIPWSVCVCICLSVITMNCITMAKLIEMPFGLWIRVGPRNCVLGGGPYHPGRVQFCGATPYDAAFHQIF